jgi:hypothetical protein
VADSKQPLAIDARPPQQHWGQDGLQRQSRRQSQTDLNQPDAQRDHLFPDPPKLVA